jgi:hypothetical protein
MFGNIVCPQTKAGQLIILCAFADQKDYGQFTIHLNPDFPGQLIADMRHHDIQDKVVRSFCLCQQQFESLIG